MGRISVAGIFLFLMISVRCLAGSDSTLTLRKTGNLPGSYTNFYADNLGNLYVITPSNQIKKTTINGDSLAVFNDVSRYGTIYSLDVSNPLQILVFYRDFTTLLILDRHLNVVNRIDLRQSGILQVKAIAHSYDNNVWLYDEIDGKLKKIDPSGNILLESPDFRLLFSDDFDPGSILDNNGNLYLYDKKEGWLIFDYYGAFKTKIPFTGWNNVQVTGNLLTGFDSTGIQYYQPSLHQYMKLSFAAPLLGAKKICQQMQNLYVLDNGGISEYTLQ